MSGKPKLLYKNFIVTFSKKMNPSVEDRYQEKVPAWSFEEAVERFRKNYEASEYRILAVTRVDN